MIDVRKPRGLIALAIVGLVSGACSGESTAPDPGASTGPDMSEAIEKVTELGPVKATVKLAPEAPRLGDPITLVLDVEAEPGVTVEMPPFGEALGRFQVIQFIPRQSTRDGKWVASQTYTLQAPMSGRQRIPPLRIEFMDRRPGAGAGQQAAGDGAKTGDHTASAGDDSTPGAAGSADNRPRELLTDEIALEIASVLPDGAVVDELGEPVGALEATGAWWRSPWTWALVVLMLAVAVGSVLGVRWWLQAREIRSRETAYDKAMARLAKLESHGLPGEGEADDWYVELSAIIRRYLEDRYTLRAPELTTEEFLSIARRSGQISSSHRELLSRFLIGCDRVKFARHEPEEAESRQSLEAARQFLRETRLVPIGRHHSEAPVKEVEDVKEPDQPDTPDESETDELDEMPGSARREIEEAIARDARERAREERS